MSYCGTCGGFYSPECPHRSGPGCVPAPNPHERHHVLVLAAIALANAKVAGMVADNAYCAVHGNPPQWYTPDFIEAQQPVANAIAQAVADAA